MRGRGNVAEWSPRKGRKWVNEQKYIPGLGPEWLGGDDQEAVIIHRVVQREDGSWDAVVIQCTWSRQGRAGIHPLSAYVLGPQWQNVWAAGG